MRLGVRRARYFYWFVIEVICVYVDDSVEKGGHSCNDVVLCVDIAVREFVRTERGQGTCGIFFVLMIVM